MPIPVCGILPLIAINSASLWEVPAGAQPHEAPLLAESDQGMIILLPLGDRGLGGWDGRGNPLSGFPVAASEGVSFRPAAYRDTGIGETLVCFVDDQGGLHLTDTRGREQPGWPVDLGASPVTGVSILDLDGSGRFEMAVGTSDSRIHLLDEGGSPLPGWPVEPGARLEWTASQVCLGGGQGAAVVCALSNTKVTLLRMDGSTVPGWPVNMGFALGSPPSCIDLDGDGFSDIVFSTRDRRVNAYSIRGAQVEGWPVSLDSRTVEGCCAVGQMDPASGSPQVAVACEDSLVYLLDADGSLAGTWRWPYRVPALPTSPLIVGSGSQGAVVAAASDGEIWVWDSEGRTVQGLAITHPEGVQETPAAGDIDGDGSTELVVAGLTGRLAAYDLGIVSPGPWPQQQSDSRNSGNYGLQFLPVATVADIIGEQTGDVQISYTTAGGPVSCVQAAFSTDAGMTWSVEADAAYSPGSVTWHSRADLGNADEPDCRIRITPVGPSGPGIAGLSTVFHVDNNAPPTIYPSQPHLDAEGRLSIPYSLEEPEGDVIQIQAQYSLDDGATWVNAHLSGSTLEIESWLYGEPFFWNAVSDVGEDGIQTAMLRVRAADADTGPWAVLDLSEGSSMAASSGQVIAPSSVARGRVRLGIRLPGLDRDQVRYEYSLDGVEWRPATVESSDDARFTPYEYEVVWVSDRDAPGVDCADARFRVVPPEESGGVAVPSSPFRLDNNAPPSVRIVSPGRYDVFEGLVPVTLSLSDPEGDMLTVLLEYSMPPGGEWRHAAGVLGNGPFGPGETSPVLSWNSSEDLPGSDMEGILLRALAIDSDTTRSETAGPLALRNGSLPRVVEASVSGSDTRTFSVRFVLSDPGSRDLELSVTYSLDGGMTWRAASAIGDTYGLRSPGYSGVIDWTPSSDIADPPATVLVKLTPMCRSASGTPLILELELDD